MIKVGIVDDHPVVRLALRELFKPHQDIHVAGTAQNAAEALELVRTPGLSVLVLDLNLPGRSGLDILPTLHRNAPKVGVVVYTSYSQEHFALKLMRMGARAFIQKVEDLEVLTNAVRAVGAGRRFILPSQADLMLPSSQPQRVELHDDLTQREMQVLLKLARGTHSREIAESLSLSMKSISSYRTRLLRKFDATTISELTYYVIKHQLLD